MFDVKLKNNPSVYGKTRQMNLYINDIAKIIIYYIFTYLLWKEHVMDCKHNIC